MAVWIETYITTESFDVITLAITFYQGVTPVKNVNDLILRAVDTILSKAGKFFCFKLGNLLLTLLN